MTPLAQRLMKHILERSFIPLSHNENDKFGGSLIGILLPRAALFEISDIMPLVDDFVVGHFPQHVDNSLMFWPSPVLWFEWVNDETGGRDAILVDATNAGRDGKATVNFCRWEMKNDKPVFNLGKSYDFAPGEAPSNVLAPDVGVMRTIHGSSALTAAILTLVNQPSGLDRIAQQPHKGLERQMKRAGFLDGADLLPWHKISIGGAAEVSERSGVSGQPGHRKCYHFVRAHLRQANGQFVRSHWRGDPALGIGRKVYRVVA